MIVFTIYKNGGNAGAFGTYFGCVGMCENRAKNDRANIICFYCVEYAIWLYSEKSLEK